MCQPQHSGVQTSREKVQAHTYFRPSAAPIRSEFLHALGLSLRSGKRECGGERANQVRVPA